MLNKTVEEIKVELTLKTLQGNLSLEYIEKLPKNDEIRSFICQFEPSYAYLYALYVDKCPHDETRKACIRHPAYAGAYAFWVDRGSRNDTREAAYKDPSTKQYYIEKFGE